ncbi:MAG: hypothetical protein AMQ22_01226 [Candidatus Methanofastidiosum methylothiophilum]|uniref:Phage portal protein, SPP1 Gp6-like n=1 Tax=Candidatus Methanofastidiosum methylothiophilum TaxID=1705564 RepID=A0A150J3I2_9EURY|nr:MAG: hypothetical protein AMQ22_01226 [Candidatus Methanofastidiosum methylthiophilus]
MQDKLPLGRVMPVMSINPEEKLMRMLRRYDPNFQFFQLLQMVDYPVASDYELFLHYFRGGAGPFIDLFLYCDLGADWTLNPVGFDSEEDGEEAVRLVEEDYFSDKRMNFRRTMNEIGAYCEILGRTCYVETFNLAEDYFYDKNMKVTGLDAINPMVLNEESIKKALADTTGTVPFKQEGVTTDGKYVAIPFEQERVFYFTKNIVPKYSPVGNSELQRCVTDLRTLARFPHYRMKIGKKYSELFRVIQINTEKLKETGMGETITESTEEAQKYLDETAEFYRDQEDKGGTVAVFDWETLIESSWAGKEVKFSEIERDTVQSIGLKLGVPMELMTYAADAMNRATLLGLLDTFVSKREKGTRKWLYTPIIQNTANKILRINDILDGHLEVKYNPFLSKNLVEVADILSKLYPTGAITKPEIRKPFDFLPKRLDLGGEEWEEAGMDPKPNPQAKINPVELAEEGEGIAEVAKEMLQKGLINLL